MLQDSISFNDYEYSLLHLMDIPPYKEFYKNTGRMHILDNSAYEYQFIDGGFDLDYFLKVINEVAPTHVVVPDVISDCEATIDSFRRFPRGRYKRIGVVQGQTLEELEKCFDYMNEHADVVALVFHSPAYYKGGHIAQDNSTGRYDFFKRVRSKCAKPVHLLGCSLPQEFTWYDDEDRKHILSIDTANPVQFGIMGEAYPEGFNVCEKPACVLTREIVEGVTPNKGVIIDNINKFREIIKKGNK